jgi:uncharacterized protein
MILKVHSAPSKWRYRLKLHLAAGMALNSFTAYGVGYVAVNGRRYEKSLIITPTEIVSDWRPLDFNELEPDDLGRAVELNPALVVLGTGTTLRFPAATVLQPLVRAQIGWEIMDTPAACRTYNILVQEGRRVACAVLIG